MKSAVQIWVDHIKRRPLLWVSILALPVYLLGLNAPALNDGEAMYAEIAREMRIGGDWITPHLNGTRHFDKPPLLYWLIALTQMVVGEGEFSTRLMLSLAAWGTVPVAGMIGGTLFGHRAGWLSALCLATGVGPFIFGRMALPDASMTFWIALAILGYTKGYLTGNGRGLWPVLMFCGIGFATLIKGILGMGLPLAIIGLHVLLSGRLREFLSWRLVLGAGILAGIVLPWHLAVAKNNPEFLGYFLIREHLMRFSGKRYPPDEFLSLPVFLSLTFVWTFPWIAVVPQALWRGLQRLRQASQRNSGDLLLLIWVILIVGLFSASKSRLEYYAFSSLPAFAILIGKFWDEVFDNACMGRCSRGLLTSLTSMSAIAALLAVLAFIVLGPAKDLIFDAVIRYWPGSGWVAGPEQTATLNAIRIPSLVTMAGIALFCVGSLVSLKRSSVRLAFGLCAGMMIPVFTMVYWGFLVMEPFMSSRQIAEIVSQRTGPNDIVVVQEPHEYMWIGGITFYTGRMVHILKDPKFEGVTSRRREPPERFLDETELREIWGAEGKGLVLVADETSGLDARLSSTNPVDVLGRCGGRMVIRPRSDHVDTLSLSSDLIDKKDLM